jgi:hypothetical protein
MSTTTPRTDAAMCRMNIALTCTEVDGVPAAFARTLEAELQAAWQRSAVLTGANQRACRVIMQLAELANINGFIRGALMVCAHDLNKALNAALPERTATGEIITTTKTP